jgi:hypothetical protein
LRQRDYFFPGPQALFGFMRTAALREHAMELGGYDVDAIGAVRLVNNHRPRHEHLELFSIGDASLLVRKNASQRCD